MAIILAVVAVLYYKQTVIDPPKAFAFKNLHNIDLSKSINRISVDSMEEDFADISYKLKRYEEENLVGSDTIDLRIEDLVVKYIPMFINRCNVAFSKTVWNSPEWSHKFMINRVSKLKNLKKANGDYIIERTSPFIGQLNDVVHTISSYDEAWRLAKATSFRSLSDTKNKIAQARQIKDSTPLCNCTSLIQALDELPRKLQSSHLASLKVSFARLYCSGISGYGNFLASLEYLYNNRILEYTNYYGTDSDILELKRKVVNRQYRVLSIFVQHATQIGNFYDYESYKNYNTKIYNYLNTYIGSQTDINVLSNKLRNSSLSANEFYNLKKRY